MDYRKTNISAYSQKAERTFTLNTFLGIDLSSGEYNTDVRRSPRAININWGNNQYTPETRHGYKPVLNSLLPDSNVYGIHINETTDKILIHAGTNLYILNGEIDNYNYQLIATGLTETFSTSFMMNGKLYIIGGGNYLEYDTNINNVTEISYIPTTIIGRKHDGGGTPFEAVNLLSKRRKNRFNSISVKEEITDTFTGNGSTTEFTLTEIAITGDDFNVTINSIVQNLNTDYIVNRITKKITFTNAPENNSSIVVKYFIDDGTNYPTEYLLDSTNIDYEEIKVTLNNQELTENTDFSVNRETGIVTFNNAPQPLTGLEGIDNITIEFAKSIGETQEIQIQDTSTANGNKNVWELEADISDFNVTSKNITVMVQNVEQTENTDYTVNRVAKTITFVSGSIPQSGEEVDITFEIIVDNQADAINNCSIFGIFGGESDSRVFLSGNSEFKNRDWQSGLFDPTYFPDTGYTNIGNNNTAIMGYVKQFDTQIIIKESSNQDGTAFLRTFTLSSGNPVFPVEQGSVNIGAISKRSFDYLQSEPLFLSSQGIVGINGTEVDNQRLIQDRSSLINTILTREPNLQNAIGIEFENRYHLFINNKVYVCDYRMRYVNSIGINEYEWNYWTNVNATCVKKYKNYLLFCYAGMMFRFKNVGEIDLYIDIDLNNNLIPIPSEWTTPRLNLGTLQNKKSMNFIYFLFSNISKLNVNVEVIVDNNYTINLGNFEKPAILDFNDINFNDFSFVTQNNSFIDEATLNLRKFDNISIKFSNIINNETSSGFGIEYFQFNYKLLDNRR